MAIDRRVHVRVESRNDDIIHVQSENLNLSGYFDREAFKAEQGDAREAETRFEPIRLAATKIQERYEKHGGVDIVVNSPVPVGAGLGSSAAVVTATAAAVGALFGLALSKEDIFQVAFEAEKVVHGTPSGVDPAISTFGGTLLFQMDTGFKPLDIKTDIPLIIGDTGVERSTRIQVEKVKRNVESFPRIVEPIMKSAREIVLRAVDALKEDDFETLGALMNMNHALLYALGVSDESLEWLINAARKAGSLGAKLTGAGGGGCMIALSRDDGIDRVSEAIQRAGGRPLVARKTDEGVRIERN